MGLIKAILRIFKMIVSAIKKVFGALLKRWKILLVLFAIACFVFPALLPGLMALLGAPSWMVAAATAFESVVVGWGPTMQVAAAVGTVALISPSAIGDAAHAIGSAASTVVDEAGHVISDAGSTIGDTIGQIGNSVAGAVFQPNVLLLIGGALALYMIMKDDNHADA